MSTPLARWIDDWLTGQALGATDLDGIVRGCRERLAAGGIQLAGGT